MREIVLKLLIATMLFASVAGMADSIDDLVVGLASDAIAVDAPDQWFSDEDTDDHDGDFCNHYCHAHFVGLMTNYAVPILPRYRFFSPVVLTTAAIHSAAPPIPPPNI